VCIIPIILLMSIFTELQTWIMSSITVMITLFGLVITHSIASKLALREYYYTK
jgi:hypothetical protein